MIQSSCARCSVTEARQGRFVQATEALLHPTPVLDYMHAAETHIDILCSSWIAHNAAVQRVNEVMADARRSMEYEVAVCDAYFLDTVLTRAHSGLVDVTAHRPIPNDSMPSFFFAGMLVLYLIN